VDLAVVRDSPFPRRGEQPCENEYRTHDGGEGNDAQKNQMHIWHCSIAKLVGIRSGPNERIDDIIGLPLADDDRFTPRNPDTAIGQQEAIDHEKTAVNGLEFRLMIGTPDLTR
jgi:hypothetical protein